MSTTETTRTTPSLKDRRVGVLRRKGSADRNRIVLDKPPSAFYWILVIVAGFVLLGLLMVFSSSSVTSLHAGDSSWDMFTRQVLWVAVGGTVMWFLASVPYDTWQKQAIIMVPTIVVVGLNALVIAKGRVIGGATAWLDMGPFRFQPSEFMKLMVILFAANLLAKRHRAIAIKAIVLWPMLFAMGLTCALCMLQKDYGSAVIFAGTLFMMMVMAGLPKSQLAVTGVVLAFLALLTLKFASRASERLLAFLDLEGTKEDFGYQVYQALLSIANGGWTGTGIGAGTSKWGYVPLAHSDFIFAVIAEELGIFGTISVIGGFLLLVLLAIQVAMSATDLYGAYIAGGVAAWFGIQSIVNIGGVVGVLPMTGLTLPFLSYGGSSMIVSMAAIGLLLNVARYARR